MSALAEILDRIESTNERIIRLEEAAKFPNAPASVRVSIRAMEKLRASLERDFEQLAGQEETEICRYRLVPAQGHRSIGAIAKAWIQYQALFSSVFDAIKNGPRRRSSKRGMAESQLDFGYTFSGSIGVVLTLPTQKVDFEMARIVQRTAEAIAEMAKAETTEQLAHFVDRFGVPPVAKLGTWVDAHVAFGAGAGVDWKLWNGDAPGLLVQAKEFTRLKSAMDKITEPSEVTEPVTGELTMADMDKRRFRMKLDSGERISGAFTDAINEQQRAQLPQRYEALVRTTKQLKPAIEKLEQSRFLVQLIRRIS